MGGMILTGIAGAGRTRVYSPPGTDTNVTIGGDQIDGG